MVKFEMGLLVKEKAARARRSQYCRLEGSGLRDRIYLRSCSYQGVLASMDR